APVNEDCLLPKKVGPCRAAVPRFYYNSDSGKCEGFTYGGCHANANNFKTKDECKNACH
uniref:PI-actitoxin-Axm2a n=1 Tax=Anthopleura aff. xanthogrammica TaxID=152178 RepID=VKT1_ANTAF|nr:RecName: Full=PI-actitoxin-Axm2a; Short=PI-AITX-Axm2a; AltName: Full=Kunitz-type protease inhibitor AXPI-I; Short=AXAPI [Anthopleura aff. xanthogrammica]